MLLNNKTFILIFISLVFFASCSDLFESKNKISGPYYVAEDPGGSGETLWYDLDNGSAIARVDGVKKVGHTDKFIIAKNSIGYYIIDRSKDNKWLNANEIVGLPQSQKAFEFFLDSMKIKDFKFDYSVDK